MEIQSISFQSQEEFHKKKVFLHRAPLEQDDKDKNETSTTLWNWFHPVDLSSLRLFTDWLCGPNFTSGITFFILSCRENEEGALMSSGRH